MSSQIVCTETRVPSLMVWRWGLREVILSWKWSPHVGINALIRRDTRQRSLPSLSLFLFLTVSPLPREEMRKTVLTRTGPCWHCDLGLPRTSAEL